MPTKPRFCMSASYTATCVTKIREAFPDRGTGEKRKRPLVRRIVSLFSLYLASVATLTLTHIRTRRYHVRPSYEIVFLAHGITATQRYRALKLKACSCCVANGGRRIVSSLLSSIQSAAVPQGHRGVR